MEIERVVARQILDSRGTPTVEADVYLSSGVMGRAAVPSGASTGSHEARELRDGDNPFHGMGVSKAVQNIHELLGPAIRSIRADDQFLIDELLIQADGTQNKSHAGANACLAVSLAVAHAAAACRKLPLYRHIADIAHNDTLSMPMPMMNVLNGGKHAHGSTDIQESMIVPISATTIPQAIQMSVEIFQSLKQLLQEKGYATTVGDEGGFAPAIQNGNGEAFELLSEAATKSGYRPGIDVAFAIDVAASELYHEGVYSFSAEDRQYASHELIDWYQQLVQSYPIVSIEDGMEEDDWEGWQMLRQKLPDSQLVGDDLLVTNVERLQHAIDLGAANAILIKPNQIGTLTETIRAIQLAKQNGWRTIVSHRSGETEDVSLVHIAIGTGAGQIKTGSLSRGERTAKYNELLRIAEIEPDLPLVNPFSSAIRSPSSGNPTY